jgi:hypothetical protein
LADGDLVARTGWLQQAGSWAQMRRQDRRVEALDLRSRCVLSRRVGLTTSHGAK